MKNAITSLLAIALFIAITACNKTDEMVPIDAVSENTIVSDSPDANNGITSLRQVIIEIRGAGVHIGIPPYCFPLPGICKIDWGAAGVPSGGGIGGTLSFNQNDNFSIEFPEPEGHAELDGDFFEMSAEYTIPNDLAAALEGEPYTIQPGLYPLIPVGQSKVVEFPR